MKEKLKIPLIALATVLVGLLIVELLHKANISFPNIHIFPTQTTS